MKKYKVDGLRELSVEEEKKIQIEILNEVSSFCNANGIKYYLLYGTLLGAVRHKGFIPWDDDIDIGMFREDYDNFFKCFNCYSSEKGTQYEAININTNNNYYLPMGKVINKNTMLIEHVNVDCPLGVFIDIFPIDCLPNCMKECLNITRKIKGIERLLEYKQSFWSSEYSIFKNIYHVAIKAVLLAFPNYKLCEYINHMAENNKNKDSNNMGSIVLGMYGEKEIWSRNDFEKTTLVEFEGKKYSAPVGFDNVLRKTYGDYMTLPPIERQISHHKNSAYWRKGVE